MNDHQAQQAYLIIEKILLLLGEESYCPRNDGWSQEMNPTGDPMRSRLERIERVWNWRNKVRRAMRTQETLKYGYKTEWILYRRRYLTERENECFMMFYTSGRGWNWHVKEAIGKIWRNLNKSGVLDNLE